MDRTASHDMPAGRRPRRRIVAVALAAVLAFSVMPPTAPAGATPTCTNPGGGGAGTSLDPYLISTVAHLAVLRDAVNGGAQQVDCYFEVTAALNLGNWTPIGTATGNSNGAISFRGNFDGGGQTITLAIDTSTTAVGDQGLFGVVVDATITRVVLRGSVTAVNGRSIGALVGRAFATGQQTTIQADVDVAVSGDIQVGGIVGQFAAGLLVLRDTTVRGSVEARESTFSGVGPLVGASNGLLTLQGTTTIGATVTGVGPDSGCIVGFAANPINGPSVVFESSSTLTVAGVTTVCPVPAASTSTVEAAGPSFVAPGGVLPSAPVGSGEWVQADGSSVPLVVSSPGRNQVRYVADGVRVTFTGGAGSGVSRGLVADQNGEVVCEVCLQLAAGQVIEVWMFSEPRLVAAHLTDGLPCQRFSVPVVSPLDGGGPVVAGAHTLQLALPTASGMQAVNVGVTVGGRVPGSVPAGEGPAAGGGVPVGWLLVLGLLAGGVLASRRRVEG